MTTGLSLPTGYLAGAPDALWTGALGPPQCGLADLRRAGVSSVELRSVGRDTAADTVLTAARQVWDSGLALSVHGTLPVAADARPCISPALLALGPELTRRGASVMVTVHAYQSPDTPTETLATRTVQAVQAWLQCAAQAGLPARLALELNRAKLRNDPGIDYAGLLALHRRIAHPHVGFCWDFGHACHNVRQGRLAADPPSPFIERVVHTHIHDLGPADQTHWPLAGPGTVPLERWLGLLTTSGYAGILNIELEPARFADTVDVRRAVFASLERLAEWRK